MGRIRVNDPPMSPNLRQVADLFHGAARMLDDGMSPEEVREVITRGLRACWPARAEGHERLTYECHRCEDTGWVRGLTAKPETYRREVEVRVTRPCSCRRGILRAALLERLEQEGRERRGGRKADGLTQVRRMGKP